MSVEKFVTEHPRMTGIVIVCGFLGVSKMTDMIGRIVETRNYYKAYKYYADMVIAASGPRALDPPIRVSKREKVKKDDEENEEESKEVVET